ncbi:MAG: hypothetical protein DRP09_15570 [Candidatus Thorarchaeota archaeon]|nr:MAG: hypothetical protein DRP09_15570 [Candidatus Thorarchaeota archaeon]
MEKLKEILRSSNDYRTVRDRVKEFARQIGWANLKKEIGFKNFRRQFFNVVSFKTENVNLILKGESERYFYFDIRSARAYKDAPQIKIAKSLIFDPESFNLEILNSYYPHLVVIQKEISLRHTKAVDTTEHTFFLKPTLQICIKTQKIPYLEEKSLKVFIGIGQEKETTVGSWASYKVSSENALFCYTWNSTSYGGTHWEKGYLVISKLENPIEVSYSKHGKKKLYLEEKRQV